MEKDEILAGVRNYSKLRSFRQPFIPFETPIPVSGSVLHPDDIVNLVSTALSGWITEGKQCDEFGHKLKKYVGLKHVILCNSGSSANLLAMSAIVEKYKPKQNSLVVTSALAFQTTVSPIIQCGLVPLFVDADLRFLNPDPWRLVELAKHSDVCGIILAHTLGFPIRQMYEIAEEYHRMGKFVIEDCCDALGAMIDGDHHVGVFGDVATFSFFPAHQITCGEGGAVLTNDGRLYRDLQSYCNWGRDCWCKPGEENTCNKRFSWEFPKLPEGYDHKYVITKIGYNLKMTDMQAAIGNSQMNRVQEIIRNRLTNYYYLLDGFRSIPNFNSSFWVVHETEPQFTSSPFGCPIVCLPDNVDRKDAIAFLEKCKIKTRPLFTANITRHPMMQNINYVCDGSLTNCDALMENAFWIGCHPELSCEQLDFVIQSFDDYLVKLWKR